MLCESNIIYFSIHMYIYTYIHVYINIHVYTGARLHFTNFGTGVLSWWCMTRLMKKLRWNWCQEKQNKQTINMYCFLQSWNMVTLFVRVCACVLVKSLRTLKKAPPPQVSSASAMWGQCSSATGADTSAYRKRTAGGEFQKAGASTANLPGQQQFTPSIMWWIYTHICICI